MRRREAAMLALLILLCMIVAVLNPRFLGGANLQNLARLVGIYGIFSLGAGLVILTGGIDLSVGSLLALLGVLLSFMLLTWHVPWPVAVVVVVMLGAALGWVHGRLVARLTIQPFLVTLCGLLVYRGLARFASNDETRGFGDSAPLLRAVATGTTFGVPTSFLMLLCVAAVLYVVVHRSVVGRHLLAVGCNEEAARYAGIATGRVITGAYVAAAGLTALASVLLSFYTDSVSPSSHGSFYELYAIAACVLGGCSLRGGEGGVAGILIGTALLQVLQNLVNLLGIPSSLNFAVMGAVILVGAVADRLLYQHGVRAATGSRRFGS